MAAFKMYLPRDDERTVRAADGLHERKAAGGRQTVLLVEDEEAVRDLVATYLRGAGYTVVAAADGRDAEQLVIDRPTTIDLLLTDVIMPHVSGRELAARLQRQQPGLKVLFMSGYTEDRILRQGIADERVAYVQKPFSATTFLTSVRSVLDRR